MIRVEVNPDEHIEESVKSTKALIETTGSLYGYLIFNGIELLISVDSNVNDIITIYDLKRSLMGLNLNVN
jgi:hypothetical protein